MRKPLVLFNAETGETFPLPPHWKIRWQDKRIDDDKARIRVNSKGKDFGESNVGIWEENPDTQVLPLDHPEFGEMQLLNSKRKFTKVYQLQPCKFPKDSFYRIWHHIERSVEQDTGIIIRRTPNGSVKRVTSVADWKLLTDLSDTTIKEFIRYTFDHGYIARFEVAQFTWYIINPAFMWNGSMIPTAIWTIFYPPELNGKNVTVVALATTEKIDSDQS